MPREIIIFKSGQPQYECAAQFFAALAYPEDPIKRDYFFKSLCVMWLYREEAEAEYIPIRGSMVQIVQKNFVRVFNEGLKVVYKRYCVGYHMVLTKFLSQADRMPFSKKIEGMLGDVMAELNWKDNEGTSIPTAKTKLWKPSWPVAHACGGLSFNLAAAATEEAGRDEEVGPIEPAKVKGAVLEFMKNENESAFDFMLIASEAIRLWALKTKAFKHVTENSTIQFVKLDQTGEPIEFLGGDAVIKRGR